MTPRPKTQRTELPPFPDLREVPPWQRTDNAISQPTDSRTAMQLKVVRGSRCRKCGWVTHEDFPHVALLWRYFPDPDMPSAGGWDCCFCSRNFWHWKFLAVAWEWAIEWLLKELEGMKREPTRNRYD